MAVSLSKRPLLKKDVMILFCGLSGDSGAREILHRLTLLDESTEFPGLITHVPTIGFKVKTVEYKNISFTIWDVGGQDKSRPIWRHYFQNTQGLIFVVDSNDRERVGEVNEELLRMLAEDDLRDAVILVFANNQDKPIAMGVDEIKDKLVLYALRNCTWYIQAASAASGDGISEGFDWIHSQLYDGTLELYEEAMKHGWATVRTATSLIFGMAGAGKSSLKHLLFGMDPPDTRNSTPLADSAEHILLEGIRSCSTSQVQMSFDGKWLFVSHEELKAHLAKLMLACDTSVHVQASKPKPSDIHVSEDLALLASKMKPLIEQQQTSSSEENSCSESDSLDDDQDVSTSEESDSESEDNSLDTLTEQNIVELISQFKGKVAQEVFSSDWIYLIDSGGQPHFHSLLPLFIQDISLALYVFRLSQELDSHPMIEYYKDGRPVIEPSSSHLTIAENFRYLIQSLQSLDANAMLVCVGTHYDQIQNTENCGENMRGKNDHLVELLPESMLEQCHFTNTARREMIFPVNTLVVGPERDSKAEQLRSIICRSTFKEIKVPLWWYYLQIKLKEIAVAKGTKVLSLDQCREISTFLQFHEDSLLEALKFFHQHHIFHYYPMILPNVVFVDTQVLLDKVTELIEHAAYCRDGSNTLSAGDGSLISFSERGVISTSLLSSEAFSKHYVPGLFGPSELIKIFEHLLIATSFDLVKEEYFMPALLGFLSKEKLAENRALLANPNVAPLHIRFRNGILRCGVFCCLQVSLLKECHWSLGNILRRNSKKPKQNMVKLFLPDIPGSITLIDSISCIEVHTNHIQMSKLVKIKQSLLIGIKSAYRALQYKEDEVELAFSCPCAVAGEPAHHAVVLGESGHMQCSLDEDKYFPLEKAHTSWLEGLTIREGITFSDSEITDRVSAMGLSDYQVNSPLTELDCATIAGYFDHFENYIDHFDLENYQKANARRKSIECNRSAVLEILGCWRKQNPSAANFEAIVSILYQLGKSEIAMKVCEFVKDNQPASKRQ